MSLVVVVEEAEEAACQAEDNRTRERRGGDYKAKPEKKDVPASKGAPSSDITLN